jgi:hypothetical protein
MVLSTWLVSVTSTAIREKDMKNYLIETTANGYFVHAGDTPYGGPYKNEESAKRRIRDLKRKEINAGVHSNLVTPTIETAPTPVVASMDNYVPPRSAPVEKLAMSSEYGKSKPFTIDQPRGVYPAVSKHSYQR